MIDRHYFEELLPEQVRAFKLSVSVQVSSDTGRTYEAFRLSAAHDHYVILEVYPEYGAEPLRLGDRQDARAGQPPVVMDQVVLPYARIAAVYFSARSETPSSGKTVGFNVSPKPVKKDR